MAQDTAQVPRWSLEPPRKPAPGMSPAEVWARCEQATNEHPYIMGKRAAGVPLDGLRVLPAGDGLRIAGEPMAGALVVGFLMGLAEIFVPYSQSCSNPSSPKSEPPLAW